MGFIKDMADNAAKTQYDYIKKKLLVPKDGLLHILMLENDVNISFNFDLPDGGYNTTYTTKVDYVLTRMQDDGYSIIDVKVNSVNVVSQGTSKKQMIFYTLITYH